MSFLVLTSFFFSFKVNTKKPENPGDIFFDNQKRLGRMVRKDGPVKAYRYFHDNFKYYDPSTNHYLGHFLGEEIYRVMGDSGFDVCDFGLDYGCIHGFVIAGIGERGDGFFNTVMDRCMAIDPGNVKRGSCIHGVSHTILALKGYSNSDLNWALSKCDSTLKDGVLGDREICYSAVFMENNLMSLDGRKNGDWFITRKFDSKNPTYPCNKIDEKYAWSCYSELGSFWSNNFGIDFMRMAKYCDTAIGLNSKQGCFWGVGRTMSDLYKYDISKIGNECQRISSENTLPFCINGASVVMLNNGVNDAIKICEFTKNYDKNNCLMFFKNNKSL